MKLSNYFFIYIIVRIKCNRCGKGNDNLFNHQNSYNNRNNIISQINQRNDIGEGLNEIYYCPFMKARIFLKGNNKEDEIKDNIKNRRPFIERPGDWICYNCQNLNFQFRTNCNRCHIPKTENQKLIQNLEMNRNMMNINNNFQ